MDDMMLGYVLGKSGSDGSGGSIELEQNLEQSALGSKAPSAKAVVEYVETRHYVVNAKLSADGTLTSIGVGKYDKVIYAYNKGCDVLLKCNYADLLYCMLKLVTVDINEEYVVFSGFGSFAEGVLTYIQYYAFEDSSMDNVKFQNIATIGD